jgi:hypothetical protein
VNKAHDRYRSTCTLIRREFGQELLQKVRPVKAAAYALNHWVALARYCDDRDPDIDNTTAERSLRGIAVGAITGLSSAATAEAKPRQCCGPSWLPVNE